MVLFYENNLIRRPASDIIKIKNNFRTIEPQITGKWNNALFKDFLILCFCCCVPLSGIACEPVFLLSLTVLRRKVCRLCVLSVCFRTPRLSLGHPGYFKSAHDLKCMRMQTTPLFNLPLWQTFCSSSE